LLFTFEQQQQQALDQLVFGNTAQLRGVCLRLLPFVQQVLFRARIPLRVWCYTFSADLDKAVAILWTVTRRSINNRFRCSVVLFEVLDGDCDD
jgi:hypothetical protein